MTMIGSGAGTGVGTGAGSVIGSEDVSEPPQADKVKAIATKIRLVLLVTCLIGGNIEGTTQLKIILSAYADLHLCEI
jgi:hypothetical protein